MAAYAKGTGGQHLAILDVGLGAFLIEYIEQHAILGLAGHDDHVLEVLGSGANKRDAAYVYLLDDVSLRGTAGYGLLKWVEIHDDQVDGRDGILFHLGQVAHVLPTGQDASEYLGVKRLDAAAKDRGIAGHFLDLLALISQRLDKLLRAASRQEFHTCFIEFLQQLIQPVLVKHGDERGLYLLCFCHNSVLLYNNLQNYCFSVTNRDKKGGKFLSRLIIYLKSTLLSKWP